MMKSSRKVCRFQSCLSSMDIKIRTDSSGDWKCICSWLQNLDYNKHTSHAHPNWIYNQFSTAYSLARLLFTTKNSADSLSHIFPWKSLQTLFLLFHSPYKRKYGTTRNTYFLPTCLSSLLFLLITCLQLFNFSLSFHPWRLPSSSDSWHWQSP